MPAGKQKPGMPGGSFRPLGQGRWKDTGKQPQAGLWALLCTVNMTAGVCTSMGVFLNAILVAAAAFWLMVAERKFSILVKAGLVCIPNVIYMALYLFLHV